MVEKESATSTTNPMELWSQIPGTSFTTKRELSRIVDGDERFSLIRRMYSHYSFMPDRLVQLSAYTVQYGLPLLSSYKIFSDSQRFMKLDRVNRFYLIAPLLLPVAAMNCHFSEKLVNRFIWSDKMCKECSYIRQISVALGFGCAFPAFITPWVYGRWTKTARVEVLPKARGFLEALTKQKIYVNEMFRMTLLPSAAVCVAGAFVAVTLHIWCRNRIVPHIYSDKDLYDKLYRKVTRKKPVDENTENIEAL